MPNRRRTHGQDAAIPHGTLLDLEQAASVLNIPREALETLVAERRITCVRVDNAVLFERVHLHEYLQRHAGKIGVE